MKTNHRREHTPVAPHVQAVVVCLEINQQFGPFEVPRSHADIVLSLGMVELGQTPVDQPQLQRDTPQERVWDRKYDKMADFAVIVINHDIVRLDIAVHDSFGVAIIQRLPRQREMTSPQDNDLSEWLTFNNSNM